MKARKIFLFIICIAFSFCTTAQTVYITKTGKKYHKNNCRYLKYSKKEITLEKAIALGYQACLVCKPVTKSESGNKASSTKSLTTKEQTRKVMSVQCSGKTKSGSRCKRTTKNANGRCYQHQ
ncbi:hypothetical protein [Flavivirga sp. 57AJ16]|uniref:hypothetical protein n=1 Tax=Flavivirga sp. 57AJ16 TaxID=3025307 RepID=UPI0023666138|nr:hypothetical protein [Flavivirga sp. 57AJ16]MDD7887099.1 hypothetical protein [Flavivirga sp. 57AJ16]